MEHSALKPLSYATFNINNINCLFSVKLVGNIIFYLYIGNSIVKVVPLPVPSEETLISPL